MSNNVIFFPRMSASSIITNQEQMAEAVSTMRERYIDVIVDDIAESVMFRAHIEGIDLSQEKCLKPFALALESIRSVFLKAVDIEHFLQDAAEEVINFADSEESEEQ
jgi:hypothetical protein